MRLPNTNALIKHLLGCWLISAAAFSHAASVTQNITLTGSIAPPPATCSFQGSSSMSFNGPVDPDDNVVYSSVPADISIICSPGATYSLSTALDYHPVTVGSASAQVYLAKDKAGTSFFGSPITGTGTGAAQIAKVYGQLNWNFKYTLQEFVGVVSGAIPLTLTY
jgi:spore coat protein U-like protein